MINAAITPGTHPATVRIETIKTEPQPQSITDKGGNTIAKITLRMDMMILIFKFLKF